MTSLVAIHRRRDRLGQRCFVAVLGVAVAMVGVVPAPAQAAKAKAAKERRDRQEKKERDPREMAAREAFAAGNYRDALDIYTKLYASQLHPTYLRNIARCYQNLNEPDRAISSFREYLRKAKDLSTEERGEVEGYIKEMEELQRRNQAAAAAAAAPAVAVSQPLPAAAPPVAAPEARSIVVVERPAPAPEPAPAFYKRAWFWGLVGGVVIAGTVAGLWAGGVFSPDEKNNCGKGITCGGIQ